MTYKFDRSRVKNITDEQWEALGQAISSMTLGKDTLLRRVAKGIIDPPAVLAVFCCLSIDGRAEIKTWVYHTCNLRKVAEKRLIREGLPYAPWTCSVCSKVLSHGEMHTNLRYDVVVQLLKPTSV